MSLNVYILCLLTTSLPHQQSVPGNEHFRSHDLSSAPEIGPSCTIFRVGFLLLPPSPARNRAFALVFGVVGFLLLPPLRNRASVLDFWDGGLPAAITTTTNESEHPCSISCVVVFSLLLPLLPPEIEPPCSISGGGCLLAATTTTTLEIERLCSISGVVDDFSTTTRPPEMELSRSIS